MADHLQTGLGPPGLAQGAPDRDTKRQAPQTILVLEDDASLRRVFCALLRKQGYGVLEAQNGPDAILLFEQHAAIIDLLLADVVLARMSGPQVAARLVASRPELKVIYMSGHTASQMLSLALLTSGTPFLQKPIAPDVLIREVRGVLTAARKPGPV